MAVENKNWPNVTYMRDIAEVPQVKKIHEEMTKLPEMTSLESSENIPVTKMSHGPQN